ncbi:unconventional myosin-IXAb-like isoform X3 [Brienomyrus brachyistius]|uniref:unconventional myosin-IXAb-like isoform X3 n=1 Tax=Brienomyrus brachyistius TaxID=42636 RepID=UPI0020B32DFC|nr:unconventional myosin-IXAb-like isoform X3 [Brienomyrus brachyistius]
MSLHDVGGRRRFEDPEFTLRIYPGSIAEDTIYCPVSARKTTTAAEVIGQVIDRLRLDRTKCYVLAEVKEFGGEEWILNPTDCPVQRMMLWPRMALENRVGGEDYRFLLREKNLDGSIHYGNLQMWLRVTDERRRLVERGLLPPPQPKDHDDLCNLPDLNEKTLLENLRSRFKEEKIYTYVGCILVAINPFKFLPIYNPKYVKMYDNHRLGKLEPHIYAVADVAYHAMLQRQGNQCIVISGESGSGKTQSTNFLIHHLTALSQKGFASGVEQTILGAGPVLEAFGNAKTAHNNNSSRFGKFIQVNYLESGTVRGAYVEKYLLEKSRLVYQEHNERNYHVFYYLLAGASEEERLAFHLRNPDEYHYLNQMTKKAVKLHWENDYESELDCFTVEGEDLKHDFERLQLAMEMVGFLPATRKQIFSLLSAILHLGNIRYKRKIYRDDSIDICNPEVLPIVSELLEVKEEMLIDALTTRKTVAVGERLIVPYKLAEAGTVRDSMAKSLYGALFDWIVFRINHALLNNRDLEERAKILSIGVLDIFGFEDYENNSFEQFCINFANERLQHYFNQHTFKLEQEEYCAEGISWHNIDYIDNSGCISLISRKPTALFHLLDEECNFPQASNQTLLDKFKRLHEGNSYIEFPAVMEPAFIICHYAGKVKYGVKDFREKNTDHMRPDIVALLRSSRSAFIGGLIGIDPVATFRWAVLRAYFRATVAFREAGRRHKEKKGGRDDAAPCAILKSVDNFSFLLHPVHQRSLEILQRCKEERHSIARKSPRTPLSDLQGSNTLNEKSHRGQDSSSGGWSVRGSRSAWLSSSVSPSLDEDGVMVNSSSSKILERAHGILMRNKNYKSKPSLPKHLLDIKSLRYLSSLTLHDRITKSLLHLHKKKKPPSISAQFQASLNKLMETLGQSEPYFVKCIRSNAEKLPLRFNDTLVLRQLRYTGMLETVRIRQSGYSIKYSHQDFVHHFHLLLPHGSSPTQQSISDFVRQVDLAPDGCQVGRTMVFLREAERQRLQELLHQEALRRIVALQRRFRAVQERNRFLGMRLAGRTIQRWWRACRPKYAQPDRCTDSSLHQGAAVCLQAAWRGYCARRSFLQWREAALVIQRSWRQHRRGCRERAALTVQTAWRGHRQRQHYLILWSRVVLLQAACRGHLARLSVKVLKEQKPKEIPLQNGEWSPAPDAEAASTKDHSCEDCKRELPAFTGLKGSPWHAEADTNFQEVEDGEAQGAPSTQDEPVQKTRAKRENRRMRELEQAQFSLEMLKVRSTAGRSSELVPGSLESPQDTPDSESSQESFHLPRTEDGPPVTSEEVADSSSPIIPGSLGDLESCYPNEIVSSDILTTRLVTDTESPASFPKIENHLPTFYVPPKEGRDITHQSPEGSPTLEPDSTSKALKGKKLLASRPMVVVISMHKETPLDDVLSLAPGVSDSCNRTIQQADPSPTLSPSLAPSTPPAPTSSGQAVLEHLERLQDEREERRREEQRRMEQEMMEQIRLQRDQLEREREEQRRMEQEMMEQIRLQRDQLEREREEQARKERERLQRQCGETLQRIQEYRQVAGRGLQQPGSPAPAPTELPAPDVSSAIQALPVPQADVGEGETAEGKSTEDTPPKKCHTQTISITMTDKFTDAFYSPWESKASFSRSEKDLTNQGRSMAIQKDDSPLSLKPPSGSKGREVAMPGHRKRVRMARTRSDFLTRASSLEGEGGGASEEDEYDVASPFAPPLSPSPPLPTQDAEGGAGRACHSDSETRKMHKAMSSGDLGKTDSLRKGSHFDGSRVRGKMRFWGKAKPGDKKALWEKSASVEEPLEGDSAGGAMQLGEHERPHAHSMDVGPERGRESKENKEPSPRAKRRRSVKISSVSLDVAPWQNDLLRMFTGANDYRCMNEFLMKKINDLESEDSKKDTMVDVVFKKALKEFRLNIFNSYSTALAMDDGKGTRYKDLYALFEHILEKSMRQEQRDWAESPVRVWVNTFKVFLDEFMTECKPLDSTASKVPKPERKKRRKKESDIVEEHNGHIFKSTQYNIPTYCEYCSSLIWIMDRACVCKLCRYACHRKCCLRTTAKCSKKYDPEMTPRQFSVEVSRLTSEDRAVPLVVEKLINYIEMHGLYTEGIYRKSGSANKIKELKQGLDADVNSTNLDDYNIHVIASVFKQWLRDLPNPLLTFELYEEFLRAMGLQDKKEMIQGVYSVIDQLSRNHQSTLERLIFHLVRIVLQEETNRMSANALAIVFAPCILRCPDSIDPLQSVQDISKTTACVELIICEQMSKYKARLRDISSLEFAENKARTRLNFIRRSMGKVRLRRAMYRTPSPPMSPRSAYGGGDKAEESSAEEASGGGELTEQQAALQQEERLLMVQIEGLQREKEELTFDMLALEPRASDEETMESEASFVAAVSSENLDVVMEGAAMDLSERPLMATLPKRSESKRRRHLRRQPESLDSADSSASINSSFQSRSSTTRRLRYRSSSPPPPPAREVEDRPCFPTCSFSPENGRQRTSKKPPRRWRDPTEAEPDFGTAQPLVLYGSNEFMV